MLSLLTPARKILRRHPVLTTGFFVLLLAAVGGHFWALDQFRAAEREFRGEQYDQAERHIQACLHLWPRSVRTHILACRIERFRMNFDRAAEQLAEAERLQGGASEATQTEWVLLRAQRDDIDEVAPGLWYCVREHHPESPLILETLAKTYASQMRFNAALAALDHWVEVEPGCSRALAWRGWVHERLESVEKARADYEAALEREPGRDEVRIHLLFLLLDRYGYKEADHHLKILEGRHPDRPEVLIGRARCDLLLGKVDRARGLLARVLEAEPANAMALYWRGYLELEAGTPAAAEDWFRRLLKEDPAHEAALYGLTQALSRLHRPASEIQASKERLDRLSADFRRLKDLSGGEPGEAPLSAARTAEAGAIFLRLGQVEQGRAWLHRALTQDPNCRRAHEALVKYYEATGQPKQAAEHRHYLPADGSGQGRKGQGKENLRR